MMNKQFLKMVTNVRRAELMKGSGIKAPNDEENLGRKLHRRSLISVKPSSFKIWEPIPTVFVSGFIVDFVPIRSFIIPSAF